MDEAVVDAGGVQERIPLSTVADEPSDISTEANAQSSPPASVAETALVPATPAVQLVFATTSVGAAMEEAAVSTSSVFGAESSVAV